MPINTVRDKNPTILISLLFLLIPLDYVFPHIGNATVVTIISIVIIVYGFFYVLIRKKGKLYLSNGSLAIVFLGMVFLISFLWAINQHVVWSRFVSVANTILLFIIIIQFRFDKKSIIMVENAAILGATILTIYVLTKVNLSLVYAGYRLKFSQLGSEYFSDPNGLAARVMFPLIIAINRVFYSKRKIIIPLYSILIVGFSYILLLSASRASIIALAIAAFFFILQGFEKKKGWILIGFMILLVLFSFAPRFLPEHITQRVFNLEKYREVAEIEGDRIDIWKHVVLDLFFSSPLWGYGGGCSSYALAQFYGRLKAVHNSYLMILCELGLLGFVPWMYFVMRQIKESFNLRKFSTTILPATAAVLFMAMTLDAFTEKYLWSIFVYIYIVKSCFTENK